MEGSVALILTAVLLGFTSAYSVTTTTKTPNVDKPGKFTLVAQPRIILKNVHALLRAGCGPS
jgi:hypothetical protein